MNVAVAPSEDIAFVLQLAGVGALLGSAYAAWRRSRDRGAETWMPTALGGLGGAAVGVVVVVLLAVT